MPDGSEILVAEPRILIVKLGALGDVVMASTIVEAVRTRTPNAHITWMCGASVQELVGLFAVDEVVVVDDAALLRGTTWQRVRALASLVRRMLGRRYDVTLLGNVDRRYRVLLLGVRAGRTRTWSRRQTSTTNPIPGRSHSDEYVRMLDPDPTNRGPIALRAPLPDVRGSLPDAGEPFSANTVVLIPGGARNLLSDTAHRRWPLERYAELARRLIADGRAVIIAGDRGDAWVRPAFEGVAIDDRIGTCSITQTIALFSRVGAVVSHDTGPLHLARLARAHLIALFGPTTPAERLSDGEDVHVIWGGSHLACRPCYNGRFFAQCENHLCMQDISVERVYAALDRAGRASVPQGHGGSTGTDSSS